MRCGPCVQPGAGVCFGTHRLRPREAGVVSLRLLLGLGLLAALGLPLLLALQFDPSLRSLIPVQRTGLMQVLALQALLSLAVLAALWAWRVARPLAVLRSRALALAGGRLDAARGPQLLRSQLNELSGHLTQAQQRIEGLVQALEARNRDMHRLAMHDALTGLPNRRLFRDMFEHAAAMAQRRNRPMALLFIDLDHFKAINDRHGHPAGDELLLCISQRLRDTMRGSDLVGRLSGDEFVALLPETASFDAIAHTALRLIQAVETPVSLDAGRVQGEVSASIGVARFPRDGEDFDAVLDHADQAMYRAKSQGRGRYAVYQPSLMDDDERQAAGSDGEMNRALSDGEMQLHFQPVIDTDSGRAVGVEALMRWQHPRDGLLPPARFIHRAEECGQLHALGLQTQDQACAQLATWKRMGLRTGRLSINVSAQQFRHAEWAHELAQAMLRHRITDGELAVELTESALMEDAESTEERVRALRSMGVSLVIDDFGTGLISLTRLGELHPAMIKLDPVFVQRLPHDADARALVAGIVGLARSLAIDVVAEGVETAEQRDALGALGCHLQQGFLFARPQPALPEPAWPLPPWPQGSPLTTQGANDSELGDLMPLDLLHGGHPQA